VWQHDLPLGYTVFMDEGLLQRWKDATSLQELDDLFAAVRKAHEDVERRFREKLSELLETTAALQESEERFRLMVENVQDYAIFMLDPAGNVRTWNEGAQRLKGYTAEEIIGKHFSIFYTAEDLRAGKPDRELRIADVEGRVSDEGWRVRKDGTRFWANVAITALRDSNGVLRGFGKVTRDMTARRESEQRMAEHAAQTAETNEQLEMFAYTVSHDLRAPLRAMHTLAEALEEDFGSALPPEGHEYTRRIIQSAQRMDLMINDLLAYSRITRVQLKLESVDLAAAAHSAVSTLQPDISKKAARINLNNLSGQVIAHRPMLIEVIINLLSNAIKFTAPGVVPKVQVYSERRGSVVRVTFADNGIGIAGEHQERIFNMLERLHGVETYPGTGVGLAIVKKAVERMGGTAGVDSALGSGSRFWFELPGGGAHA
jgi:PAS domain S-box-containing protein